MRDRSSGYGDPEEARRSAYPADAPAVTAGVRGRGARKEPGDNKYPGDGKELGGDEYPGDHCAANVNRGTFYLHFPDTYMLADAVVRERFHQQLASVLSLEPRWDRRTLRLLIRAVLNLFEEKYDHQQQRSLVLAPMVEQAMHEELTELLLTWLKEARGGERRRGEPLETIAHVVSSAIFETAIQWSQEETTVAREEMVDVIAQVIMEGVARLVPDALRQ